MKRRQLYERNPQLYSGEGGRSTERKLHLKGRQGKKRDSDSP